MKNVLKKSDMNLRSGFIRLIIKFVFGGGKASVNTIMTLEY